MEVFPPTHLRLDESRHDAFLGSTALGLTPREFELLSALMARSNEVVSTDELMHALWGTSQVGGDHPIHVYISRLRAKLASRGETSPVIHTLRGRGYMYVPLETEQQKVALTYDQHLILRKIDPGDRLFLGWDPAKVIDTFFLLTPTQRLHSSRRAALALARVLAATGLEHHYGPQPVRCADGSTRVVVTQMRLLTHRRLFKGMWATIQL